MCVCVCVPSRAYAYVCEVYATLCAPNKFIWQIVEGVRVALWHALTPKYVRFIFHNILLLETAQNSQQ